MLAGSHAYLDAFNRQAYGDVRDKRVVSCHIRPEFQVDEFYEFFLPSCTYAELVYGVAIATSARKLASAILNH
jgi:hypothetical protein